MAVFNNLVDDYLSIIADNTRRLGGKSGQLTLKQIHDELIRLTGLGRANSPSTPGDYLKGIAVCIRYLNKDTSYLTRTSTLQQLSDIIKNVSLQ